MKPMHTILEYITKAIMAILGGLWAWVEPTMPFAGTCVVAVIADMVSAWRLSARLKRQGHNTDGRLSSARAGKMIGKLIGVYTAMLLAAAIEATVLDGLSVRLPNIVAGVFCGVSLLSILENESSANGHSWARIAQRIVKSKIERHIDLTHDQEQGDADSGEVDNG